MKKFLFMMAAMFAFAVTSVVLTSCGDDEEKSGVHCLDGTTYIGSITDSGVTHKLTFKFSSGNFNLVHTRTISGETQTMETINGTYAVSGNTVQFYTEDGGQLSDGTLNEDHEILVQSGYTCVKQ